MRVNWGLCPSGTIWQVALQRNGMKNNSDNDALLHATLEAAVDAIIVSDAEGLIVRANPAACGIVSVRTIRTDRAKH